MELFFRLLAHAISKVRRAASQRGSLIHADRRCRSRRAAGVASSGGRTPDTIEQMARDAEAFIDALGLTVIDVLAHSMGGLVGQQVALDRPELVRKLVV
ncbi:alpha/beta fold hydrolase [Streptomyces chattanoogensis]|uniref:AB hydrolase-1 domain-containing protein n=1 Tax=Streptomyces chattanoogensis TaxID=66876 RepID=A0A0N1JXF5_9ACTN|nr:hypothetical protein ADL29_18785 [Streptomyces chattanoogensis]